MRIKDLITRLQELPEDLFVVVAEDAEGNGYSLADASFSAGHFDEDENEFLSSDDMNDLGDDDDEYVPESINAIVIWPI